ncbi:hypothetical protein L3Y34_009564 [Caenorhabditis briggsae]|uniref:G-protein coupled receptors family 1 profile domain-containing protein n=1 Tax=Caenorhabditis briggsae TaxID=6238 RepID=A0AAE9A649_CAEBR|nr:hypothetical protein L3Y34_009564 [Caenorhabditis briggsae]
MNILGILLILLGTVSNTLSDPIPPTPPEVVAELMRVLFLAADRNDTGTIVETFRLPYEEMETSTTTYDDANRFFPNSEMSTKLILYDFMNLLFLGPDYYLTLVAFLFCVPTRTMAVQMSVWYGVTIALLRALVMRNPMNLRISSLAESKNGIRVLLIITFLYSPFWIIGYFQNYIDEFEVWIPPPYCSNLVENYTRMEYIIKDIKIFGLKEEDIYQKSLVARGILCELIPCILLPIFTFLLIFELQKARKLAMGNSTIDRDRSTKLVIGITVTFLISYGPLAICHIVEFYTFEHDKLVISGVQWDGSSKKSTRNKTNRNDVPLLRESVRLSRSDHSIIEIWK